MSPPAALHRPRVSRETRRLLAAAGVALLALWVLARIRFPDRATNPNPVPPLLTQFASTPAFADLASDVSRAQNRVDSLLLVLPPDRDTSSELDPPADSRAALRLDAGTVVAMVGGSPGAESAGAPPVLARDPASGLVLLRLTGNTPTISPVPWSPGRLDSPRYLMATTVSHGVVSLRPAFIGSLRPAPMPAWSGPVWMVPAGTDLEAGSFVFSEAGELAGVVVGGEHELAIVPAATLLADAARLREHPVRGGGQLGIEVQPLTPAMAALTGADTGVVVTWVDPEGAAVAKLLPGDVIESADGEALATPQHWAVRSARLAAGDIISLRIRRHGQIQDTALVAAAPPAPLAPPAAAEALGLEMRRVAGAGARVVRVDSRSAADRAGLRAGDVITLAGTAAAPTPARVRAAFAAGDAGQPLMLAITRGETHLIVTVDK